MILLTFDIPFIFYDADVMPIIDVSNVIAEANPEVDVTTNDVEIPTLRSTIQTSLVSTGPKMLTSRRQDQH
jgi:hypothetical protein